MLLVLEAALEGVVALLSGVVPVVLVADGFVADGLVAEVLLDGLVVLCSGLVLGVAAALDGFVSVPVVGAVEV